MVRAGHAQVLRARDPVTQRTANSWLILNEGGGSILIEVGQATGMIVALETSRDADHRHRPLRFGAVRQVQLRPAGAPCGSPTSERTRGLSSTAAEGDDALCLRPA